MKKLLLLIALFFFIKAGAQTTIGDNEINFQDIFLFKNAKTLKMLEVEDGAFNKGRKVQQYFPYARNGLTDGYNQQWIIIPAGTREKQRVYHLINYGFLRFLSSMDPVVVEEGSGTDDELWIFQRVGQNWLIKSFLGNVYLQIPDGASQDGAAFTLGSFNGTLNQQFIMTRYAGQTGPPPSVSGSVINIMTAYNESKVLDASGAADREGNPLRIDQFYSGNIKQQWRTNFNTNSYQVKPQIAPAKCAEILGLSMADGGAAGCWTCVNGPNQQWIVIPVIRQSGKYILFNRNSGKALTVAGGMVSTNGTAVVQNTYMNQENAKWKFKVAQ